MSRHFGLNSELTGAIAKRLPHAQNQLSTPCSFFNQFVTEICIYSISLLLKLDYCIHSNLSYPGSAGPEGARITEFSRISEVRIREVPVTQKST